MSVPNVANDKDKEEFDNSIVDDDEVAEEPAPGNARIHQSPNPSPDEFSPAQPVNSDDSGKMLDLCNCKPRISK